MSTKVFNVLRNINSATRLREALRKIRNRLTDRTDYAALERALAARAEDFDTWAGRVSAQALEAARAFATAHAAHTEARLKEAPIPLGGAAHLELLYFIVLTAKPSVVVETGVAAGHSSQAILSALKSAGTGGRLWSSDFPYLKEPDPNAAIGWVVDPDLKTDWTLMIDGDRVNLPAILSDIGDRQIDLLHYDSDKSVDGRVFALNTLAPRLTDDSLIVFDDIQDNFHFLDWIDSDAVAGKPTRIFKIGNKYVGLVGGQTLQAG